MYQRREYREDEKIQVGFKATGKLANAVHEAAKHARFDSTSQYLDHVTREAVAKELGVTVESLDLETKPARTGLTLQSASPAVAAQQARYNALLLDVQDKMAELARIANAPVQAPAKPVTRRR